MLSKVDRQVLTPHAFTEEFARALATALPSATITVKRALELDIIPGNLLDN
jgi:hypothetical protein